MSLDVASLYGEMAGPLVTYFMAHLPADRRHDAEDLMADTFERVIRHADRYQDQGFARAWVYRIARNLMVDWIRRYQIVGSMLPLDAYHDLRSVDEIAGVESDDHTARLLAILPPGQAAAVRACYLDRQSHAEGAAALGLSIEGLKKRKARALVNLKRHLEAA